MLDVFKHFLFPILLFSSVFYNNIDSDTVTNHKNTKSLFKQSNDPIAVFNSSQNFVYITSSDVDLMAKVVFGESRSEPYEGKVAVASVILNRVIDKSFPSDVESVIKQKGAFSCVINGKMSFYPDRSCYSAVYDALKGIDPTNDALFFYNPKIATCEWMKSISKDNVVEIGNHIFFVSN